MAKIVSGQQGPASGESMDDAVNDLIAKAIRDVDWTLFNENYSKQAEEVVRCLNRAGYAIVPRNPTRDMVEAGRETIEIGQTRSMKVATSIFQAMVEEGCILP